MVHLILTESDPLLRNGAPKNGLTDDEVILDVIVEILDPEPEHREPRTQTFMKKVSETCYKVGDFLILGSELREGS